MWVNLGKVLDAKELTLYRFAQKLDIPISTVSTYFREGYDPKLSNVLRWCEVLDLSLDELMDSKIKKGKIPRPKTAIAADQSQNPRFRAKVRPKRRAK